jgi:hypothetical protein
MSSNTSLAGRVRPWATSSSPDGFPLPNPHARRCRAAAGRLRRPAQWTQPFLHSNHHGTLKTYSKRGALLYCVAKPEKFLTVPTSAVSAFTGTLGSEIEVPRRFSYSRVSGSVFAISAWASMKLEGCGIVKLHFNRVSIQLRWLEQHLSECVGNWVSQDRVAF